MNPAVVDAVDGLLALNRMVREKDAELPPEETIYLRIFGGPLTYKTDLMWFLSKYGVGGIPAEKINGVETDRLVEERHWGIGGSWDREQISEAMPRIISDISAGKRLVILEGVYSALFNPSCKWWFFQDGDMSDRYSMDVEVECTASDDVRKTRAMRRDKNLNKYRGWGTIEETWSTPFNGRDLIMSTDLAEDTEELDRRIAKLEEEGTLVPGQIKYLRDYSDFSKQMKRHYEGK